VHSVRKLGTTSKKQVEILPRVDENLCKGRVLAGEDIPGCREPVNGDE